MHCQENYMTYVQDEGCCNATLFKLRRNRHMIVITLLLVLAMVSVVAGLYNGFTFKKYSDMAILAGIFFPSVILLFICIYLAFICGQESFRSSVLSRVRHLSGGNHSRRNQDFLQYPQTNSENCDKLQVRYQPRASIECSRKNKSTSNEIYCTSGDSDDDCEAKISRKPFKSFSNSDISRGTRRNHDAISKMPGMCEVSYRRDDNHNSQRQRRRHDVAQHKEFRRCVSDSATKKKRNSKLKEDKFFSNTQSLDKLRKRVDKSIATRNVTEPSNYEHSCNERQSYPLENLKALDKYRNVTTFKESEDNYKKYRGKQVERVNLSPKEGVKKKSSNGESEIRLYSTSVLKHPYKYKQTLQFSSFQPKITYCKDTGNAASCSSSGDEQNGSFSSCDTLEIEKNSKRLDNLSSSEQDAYRLRRKTIYFPSTSDKNMTRRPPKEHAHEFCRYSNKENKTKRPPIARNEESFAVPQSDKQKGSHWR